MRSLIHTTIVLFFFLSEAFVFAQAALKEISGKVRRVDLGTKVMIIEDIAGKETKVQISDRTTFKQFEKSGGIKVLGEGNKVQVEYRQHAGGTVEALAVRRIDGELPPPTPIVYPPPRTNKAPIVK